MQKYLRFYFRLLQNIINKNIFVSRCGSSRRQVSEKEMGQLLLHRRLRLLERGLQPLR